MINVKNEELKVFCHELENILTWFEDGEIGGFELYSYIVDLENKALKNLYKAEG